MSGENTNPQGSMDGVMHGLGRLTGAVEAMHVGMTARLEDIRADIRRVEAAQAERMDRIEESLNRRIDNLDTSVGKRLDGLGTRVTALENEDKRLIEKTAGMGALGGSVAGVLATAAVELIKRVG